MGVSGRMSHAIEPKAGDFLMPDRKRKAHALRPRDVEDACFETVDGNRTVSSKRSSDTDPSSVFKSRLTQSSALGPFPRDFAPVDSIAGQTADRSERLGVFSGGRSSSTTGQSRHPVTAPAFVLTLCAATAAIFWMAGGHALVQQPVASTQEVTAPAAVVSVPSINDRATLLPDPVVTSAIPDKKIEPAGAGYTAPKARPARIERAGSILMIRPSGG